MRRYFFLFLGSLLLLASCSNSSSVEYLPFKSSSDGKWGMLSLDGEVLFEGEFRNQPTVPLNDRFLVEDNQGHINIYTLSKKPQKIGDDYIAVGAFIQDVTPSVKEGEYVKLIDLDGREVKTLDKIGNKKVVAVSNFADNGTAVVVVEKDQKKLYGCIDTRGNLTVEPKYDNILILGSGMDLVAGLIEKENGDRKIEMTDLNGKVKFTLSSDKYNINATLSQLEQVFNNSTFTPHNIDFLPIVKNDDEDKVGLVDSNGKEVLKSTHAISYITYICSDYFIYCKDGEFGIMNTKGEKLVRNKYEGLLPAGDDLFWAGFENKVKLINLDDEEVGEERFERNVLPFAGEKALVEIEKNEWGFIDKKCKEVKIKNLPDIYTVGIGTRNSEYIYSDYVDIPAIVTDIQLTATGMGGWSLDMTPSQIATNYMKQNGQLETPVPSDFGGRDRLSFGKYVEKMNLEYSVYYGEGYLTNAQYDYDYYSYSSNTTYTWSNYKPTNINVKITGERIGTNHQKLFTAIVDKLKTLGKLSKANSGAAVVTTSSNVTFVIYHNSSTIEIAILHTPASAIDISQFANNDNSSSARVEYAAPADTVEIADSAAIWD